MKTYKDFEKKYIGSSDIARLVYTGAHGETGLIRFIEDGSYSAYIVTEAAEIGEHYTLVAEGEGWLRIYDDEGLSFSCGWSRDAIAAPNAWRIYRSGDFACVIELIYEEA